MSTIIVIKTTHQVLTVETPITFSPVELPYGANGFGFNGSSLADESNLLTYWQFIENLLTTNNISTSDYITLKNITHDGVFYGVTN